jgi:hypothetical protein
MKNLIHENIIKHIDDGKAIYEKDFGKKKEI